MESSFAAFLPREAHEILWNAYDITCGAYQMGPKLSDRIQRFRHYWSTMNADAVKYVRRYHACQIHGDFIYHAPGHLHSRLPPGQSKRGT